MVGSPPVCDVAALATAAAAGNVPTTVFACACAPFCIIIAPPIMHSPTPHSVTAPAIAFLLMVISSG
jgi:hypothetical protein